VALPGEQRRDDEGVLAHVVGDLELEVHNAGSSGVNTWVL
jgi:hypothetical protein